MRPPPSNEDPRATSPARPQLSLGSIGQGYNDATPLQMALVAAGIANGGVIMTPHVLRRRSATPTARSSTATEPEPWQQAMKRVDGRHDARRDASGRGTSGTATDMAIAGFDVGAKTGTARAQQQAPRTTPGWSPWRPPGRRRRSPWPCSCRTQPGYGNEATGGGRRRAGRPGGAREGARRSSARDHPPSTPKHLPPGASERRWVPTRLRANG